MGRKGVVVGDSYYLGTVLPRVSLWYTHAVYQDQAVVIDESVGGKRGGEPAQYLCNIITIWGQENLSM